MKKFLYIPIVLLVACLCFISCSDDEDNGTRMNPASPAATAEATYTGTWTKVEEGTTNVEKGAGTIIMKKITDNIVSLEFASPTLSLAEAVNANIQWASYGLNFYNKYPSNNLGVVFSGKIEDGNTTVSYTKDVRSGRNLKKFTFSFEEKK